MRKDTRMRKTFRATLVAATAITALAVADAALAANTGSIAVWHTPMALGGSDSTTIHANVPQATDPIAAVNIYVPSGYTVKLGQAAGTTIGSVDATAFARDNGLTLPLSGPVVTDDPAKHTTDVCSPGTNAAVWNLNLSVAGQTLVVPAYVNPTSGPTTALGAYNIKFCLAPPDVPAGTPGRAFQGAQLLDAELKLNGILTTPTAGGLIRWETLYTPYNPGKGTPNAAGTFEARAIVGLPAVVALTAKFNKKTKTYTLTGKVTEGGQAVSGATVRIARGASATKLANAGSAKTGSTGTFKATGKLKLKTTTFFQASTSVGERDFTSAGCQSPLPAAFAPGGCVSATLGVWSAKSATVRVKS